MSNWFTTYSTTPIGQQLADVIDDPEAFSAFRTLSEQGKPAVQAVAADVAPIINQLSTKKERDAASQFVGWYVAQLMRGAGYSVAQERGRVSDAPYKTGAVWKRNGVEPQFVGAAPPMSTQGRLSLHVVAGDNEPQAQWELTTSETSHITGRPRRVHTVMSTKKPMSEASQEVLAYARRHGHPLIWVVDPRHLFPKANWLKQS